MTTRSDGREDAELLRRYAALHSEEAFAELVHRHIQLVHSAAQRQLAGDVHAAEDVTQTVFTELARQARRLTQHPALAGWLYTTTRRMAAHVIRANVRRRRWEDATRSVPDLPAASPSAEPDWDCIRPVLDAAMHELGETDRLAVLLRYFEQRPLREVGARLGLNENAARMRVERALAKLRDGLARRGVTTATGSLSAALLAYAVSSVPTAVLAAITSTALAASTTTASAAGLLSLMASTKLKFALAVAFATLAAVPWVRQHQANIRLEAERTRLQEQLQETSDQLRLANGSAAAAAAELERLRGREAELMRLRGEVGRLREQVSELGKLKPTPIPSVAGEPVRPSRVAFGTELQDLGATTPERAASSLIWAATVGQRSRLPELLELPANVPEIEAPKHYDFFAQQLSNVFNSMEFTSLQEIRPNTDGTLRLNFAYRDLATGRTNPFPFMLRRHESRWKVVVEGSAP